MLTVLVLTAGVVAGWWLESSSTLVYWGLGLGSVGALAYQGFGLRYSVEGFVRLMDLFALGSGWFSLCLAATGLVNNLMPGSLLSGWAMLAYLLLVIVTGVKANMPYDDWCPASEDFGY